MVAALLRRKLKRNGILCGTGLNPWLHPNIRLQDVYLADLDSHKACFTASLSITYRMPPHAKVFVHYGPYESCGIVEHQCQRLEGLQTVLERGGHSVEFVHIKDWNTVELYVNGEMIFKCDIRDLDYGGDGQLDNLCTQALEKVLRAF